MTLEPDKLGTGDVEQARAAGVSDEALVDAIHVCALFSMIVRLADALGWDVPPPEAFAARAPVLLENGYTCRRWNSSQCVADPCPGRGQERKRREQAPLGGKGGPPPPCTGVRVGPQSTEPQPYEVGAPSSRRGCGCLVIIGRCRTWPTIQARPALQQPQPATAEEAGAQVHRTPVPTRPTVSSSKGR